MHLWRDVCPWHVADNICHCEERSDVAIPRKGTILRNPRKILCTFGEKAHTSKRVSIIAPDNAISKAKCATQFSPFYGSVLYSVQRTLCHSERKNGVPTRYLYLWGKIINPAFSGRALHFQNIWLCSH